jgi:hypothetical protein
VHARQSVRRKGLEQPSQYICGVVVSRGRPLGSPRLAGVNNGDDVESSD